MFWKFAFLSMGFDTFHDVRMDRNALNSLVSDHLFNSCTNQSLLLSSLLSWILWRHVTKTPPEFRRPTNGSFVTENFLAGAFFGSRSFMKIQLSCFDKKTRRSFSYTERFVFLYLAWFSVSFILSRRRHQNIIHEDHSPLIIHALANWGVTSGVTPILPNTLRQIYGLF